MLNYCDATPNVEFVHNDTTTLDCRFKAVPTVEISPSEAPQGMQKLGVMHVQDGPSQPALLNALRHGEPNN
eukprot:9871149-Karenia_brevis.AAC.1